VKTFPSPGNLFSSEEFSGEELLGEKILWRRIIRAKNTPTNNLPPPGNFFSSEESSGEELSGEKISGEECFANRSNDILKNCPNGFSVKWRSVNST
jgi:hypothetical protein